jgi:4-hydroxyphenylacetate 3-monooxygenase
VDESLYVTYAIIPPQVDRSTAAHGWNDEPLQVGVLKENDGGFIVRGSQMLGTATAVSHYLFVSCIKPLTPEDKRYALSFVVPPVMLGAGSHKFARGNHAAKGTR